MAVFGAEQFQKSQITSRYFDKYAAIVNIGSMLSILIIPYIQDEITVNYYFIPYLIAASMLFVATVLFITGWRYYIHVNSKETVIARCIPVVINAFQSWYKYKQKRLAAEKNRNSIRLKELPGSHVPITEEEEERGLMKIDKQAFTFLDFAKKGSNYGKFQERIVDDIKTLPKAFIVFILLIPYWLLYNQVK
jgi:dipeptide/tripeptide permease